MGFDVKTTFMRFFVLEYEKCFEKINLKNNNNLFKYWMTLSNTKDSNINLWNYNSGESSMSRNT